MNVISTDNGNEYYVPIIYEHVLRKQKQVVLVM